MKSIEKWLKENGFEFEVRQYGNPYYFNDGFSVPGISVAFYFDSIGNDWQRQNELKRFMSRKKAYICEDARFGAGRTYTIMTVFDATRLAQHEAKVKAETEAFWQTEHARRMTLVAALG